MGNCPEGTEKDAGLCYKSCPKDYYGVGPVCWAGCPQGWTDIGVSCQKPSYDRGAGSVPNICVDKEYDTGLCYTKCNDGYKGIGPVCWGTCPPGFRDDGAFCAKPSAYGRGAGYTNQRACENSNDRGAKTNGCETWGSLWYPKCDKNYHNFGCCVCSPNCPVGWSDIGVSCTKPSYGRGVGTVPTECPKDQENNAGLCYTKCKDGYNGTLTRCYGTCPDNTTNAGLYCTKKTQGRGAGTVPPVSPWFWWTLLIILIVFVLATAIGIVIYFKTKAGSGQRTNTVKIPTSRIKRIK